MNDIYPGHTTPTPDPEQYLPDPNFEALTGDREVRFDSVTGNQYDIPDINGHVLAVLEMPTPASVANSGVNKQIAFVDFGEQCEQPGAQVEVCARPDLTSAMRRMIGFTAPGKRYGLLAYNYTPQDHLSSYVPVDIGEPAILGADLRRRENFSLGLTEIANDNVMEDRHVGVALTGKGSVVFRGFPSEHSAGLAVASPAEAIAPPSVSEVAQPLGGVALITSADVPPFERPQRNS